MIRRFVLLVLVAGTLSCSEGTTEPKGPRSIAVTAARDTLRFIGDTARLTATALDARGSAVAGTVFAWTSSAPDIISIDANGLATALRNGVAALRATAAGLTGEDSVRVRQSGTAIALVDGDLQGATVGTKLDSMVRVAVTDASGAPAVGVEVRFVDAGGGTLAPAQVATGVDGRASSAWTLGPLAGQHELRAEILAAPSEFVVLNASAFADLPDTMFVFAGNGQAEFPAHALPTPISVKVVDRFGNGIPDLPIQFAASGDGSVQESEVLTDLDGTATTMWTLGSAIGAQTATATLPDSVAFDIVDLPGSPVTFTATGVALTIDSIASPGTVGAPLVVYGIGFAPDTTAQTVTVGGIAAPLVNATSTALTVIVPSFGCVPAAARTVEVTREVQVASRTTMIQPAGLLSLTVGGSMTISSPESFCLQLPGGTGAAQEYIVGVTATRPLNGELPLTLTALDGVNAPPPWLRTTEPLAVSRTERQSVLSVHRDWESRFFSTRRPIARRRAANAPNEPTVAHAVGDMMPLRIPTIATDACNDFTEVQARVLAEGTHAIVVTTSALPSDPASVIALTTALAAFSTRFSGAFAQVALTHLGAPTDVDANGRVILLFAPEVSAQGVAAFTNAADLVERATCGASNEGEIIYLGAPAASDVAQITTLLGASGPELAHQFAYLVQSARRVVAGGAPLAPWLGEGLAALATELVGFAIRGDASGQDFQPAQLAADVEAARWYAPLFDRFVRVFGWDGASGRVADAPERCSLFGFGGLSTTCSEGFAAGASWSFLRYVADQLEAAGPGKRAAFLRALVDSAPAASGVTAFGTLAGSTLDDLIVRWAQTVITDGWTQPAQAPQLQFSSWDLAALFEVRPEVQRPGPFNTGFTSFARPIRLVGGGTAYTRISAGAAHGPLAVRAHDPSGGEASAELRPHLWVVRVR